jgi:glycosyltransferase involved in cell wall biosynthesis
VALKVGMIGPSLEYVGGISAVVKTWMSSPVLADVELEYFASVGVGERRDKLRQTAAAQARFIKRLAAGWRPDVFHVHCGGVVSITRKLSYLAEIRAARIPIVLHVHGSNHLEELYDRSPWHARGVRALLRQADRVVVVSQYMEDRIKQWMGDSFPVTRVYNPVAVRDFDPPEGFVKPARPTVLYIGWIIEAKGIFDLLAVAPRLAAEVPDVLVRFGGDGVHMDRFRAAAAECPTPDNIEVAGWITGQPKLDAFAGADIFCLPSYSEGLPISVLEAMSASLPVVATGISGIPEQVLEGETGLLFQPRDQDALTDRLLQLLKDPERARAMGTAGRRRVEEVFDREVVTAKVLEAWRSVV